MSRFLIEYVTKAAELAATGEPFVTVTLVQPEGHVPQDIGAKAIVTAAGISWGTVGGGRLEARAIEHSQGLIARLRASQEKKNGESSEIFEPEMIRYDLQQDLNMVCGGAATLFYELAVTRRWNIVVFGAGHVAQAVVPLLATFDANVWCIDHRQEWLDRIEARPNLRKILTSDVPGEAKKIPAGAFYLCITQGHATDLPVVREILACGTAAFIGVIGSLPKARTLRAKLLEEGFDREIVDGIRCPVGLPIGTNNPAEIAVSIAAQVLQQRDDLLRNE